MYFLETLCKEVANASNEERNKSHAKCPTSCRCKTKKRRPKKYEELTCKEMMDGINCLHGNSKGKINQKVMRPDLKKRKMPCIKMEFSKRVQSYNPESIVAGIVDYTCDTLNPEVSCRLIEFLVNECDMSNEEAEDFIYSSSVCESEKLQDSKYQAKWAGELSRALSTRTEQYFNTMLQSQRNPLVNEMTKEIMKQFTKLTGEEISFKHPKTKMQQLTILGATRLGMWIDELVKDLDKPEHVAQYEKEIMDEGTEQKMRLEEEIEEEKKKETEERKLRDEETERTKEQTEIEKAKEKEDKGEVKEYTEEPKEITDEEKLDDKKEEEKEIPEEEKEDIETKGESEEEKQEEKEDIQKEEEEVKIEEPEEEKEGGTEETPEKEVDVNEEETAEEEKEEDIEHKPVEEVKMEETPEGENEGETEGIEEEGKGEEEQTKEEEAMDDENKEEIIEKDQDQEEKTDEAQEEEVTEKESEDEREKEEELAEDGEGKKSEGEKEETLDQVEDDKEMVQETASEDREAEKSIAESEEKLSEKEKASDLLETVSEQEETPEKAPEIKPEEEQPEHEEIAKSEVSIKESTTEPFSDILDIIKEDIAETQREKKTERQKLIKDVINKRLETIIDREKEKINLENMEDTASQVAYWIDIIMESVETPKKVIPPKEPGPAFAIKQITGSTLEIHKMGSSSVYETTAQVRGAAPGSKTKKIPTSETQEWFDWVTNISSASKQLDEWIDSTLTDAEKQIVDKSKGKLEEDRDWKQWRDQARLEAQKWRVKTRKIKDEGQIWSKQLQKEDEKNL